MNTESISAIALSAVDYKENDKLVTLLTAKDELLSVIVRGVKRPKAKLRFAALPFSFCDYDIVGKTVTGAQQIEYLPISDDLDRFNIGCLLLETARYAAYAPMPSLFITLLKNLKLLIYGEFLPIEIGISFMQKVLHIGGYSYNYPPPPDIPTTVAETLAYTFFVDKKRIVSDKLLRAAFNKIVAVFEDRFSCSLKTKKFV